MTASVYPAAPLEKITSARPRLRPLAALLLIALLAAGALGLLVWHYLSSWLCLPLL